MHVGGLNHVSELELSEAHWSELWSFVFENGPISRLRERLSDGFRVVRNVLLKGTSEHRHRPKMEERKWAVLRGKCPD